MRCYFMYHFIITHIKLNLHINTSETSKKEDPSYSLVVFPVLCRCTSLLFFFFFTSSQSPSSSSLTESSRYCLSSRSGSTQVQKYAMMEKMMQTPSSRPANSRNSFHWEHNSYWLDWEERDSLLFPLGQQVTGQCGTVLGGERFTVEV